MPPAMEYDPVKCKQAKCGAVLNPYCQVDFASKHWSCPFCQTRNSFPQHYADNITETNLPAELIPQFTTLEYQLPGKATGPPAFLYLVDTCVPLDELDHLKDSIQQSLSLLPPTALVGLVTYGTMVNVHDFSAPECPRAFVFKGTKDYDSAQVQALLGLGGNVAPVLGGASSASSGSNGSFNRFLVPVSEGSSSLERILDDLQVGFRRGPPNSFLAQGQLMASSFFYAARPMAKAPRSTPCSLHGRCP